MDEKTPQENIIGANKTPDPHPDHGIIPPGASKSLDDIAGKIFEDPAVPKIPEPFPQPAAAPESPVAPVMPSATPVEPVIPESNVHVPGSTFRLNPKVILIGINLLLIAAFGAYTLFKGDLYWARDLLGMGIPSDPKKALNKASNNTNALKSYNGDVKMEMSGEYSNQSMKVSMLAETGREKEGEKEYMKFSLGEVSVPDVKNVEEAREALDGIEVITVGDSDMYFKVPSADSKWYKLSQSAIMDLNNLNTIIPSAVSSEGSDSLPFAAAMYAGGMSKETTSLTSYLKNVKRLGDEVRGGDRSYHYQADVDFAKAMGSNGQYDTPEMGLFIDKYVKAKMDFWVTKKTMTFTDMALDMTLNINGADFGSTGTLKLNLSYSMDLKNFNKANAISIPSDAYELKGDDLKEMMNGFTQGYEAGTNNTKRASDIKLYKSALEAYYASEKSYPVATDDSKDGEFLKVLIDKGYLASVMLDPEHPKYYYSYTSSDGKTYTLTYVEVKSDGTIKVNKETP